MKRKNVGKGSVVRYRTYSTCLQHNVPISGTGPSGARTARFIESNLCFDIYIYNNIYLTSS